MYMDLKMQRYEIVSKRQILCGKIVSKRQIPFYFLWCNNYYCAED